MNLPTFLPMLFMELVLEVEEVESLEPVEV